MSVVIASERLRLTELQPKQAAFVYELFNDPDCLRFIGDRGINTPEDAENYLQEKLINSYHQYGYGLFQVCLLGNDKPMGICGLVKRDEQNPPDIGFAFLPAFRSLGYCSEAARAVLVWSKENNISKQILAYTNPDNVASIRVLEKLGMVIQNTTTLPGQKQQSAVLSIKMN